MVGPAFVRVRFLGVFGTSDQGWSFGLNFAPGDSTFIPGGHLTQSQLEAITTAIRGNAGGNVLTSGVRGVMSGLARLTGIRASMVGLDGKEEAIALTSLATPIGGTGTPSMPSEVALAVSLRTGQPGRSGRGRLYLPACGASVNADGRLGTDTSTLATDVGIMVTQTRDAVRSGSGLPSMDPVVVSTVRSTYISVTSVQIGDVLDVQRRRRDKYREVYGVAAIAD